MELSDHLNQKGFHCAHLNCRSLYSKLDVFEQLLHQNESKLHILGLSETWLHSNLPDNFLTIEGYKLLRSDRSWTPPNSTNIKKGGGVSLYIRDSLSWNNDKVKYLDRSENYLEIQWIEIINENCRNFILANAYRPPDGDITDFKDFLEAALNSIDLTKFDLFLIGDFNLDYFDNKIAGVKDLKTLIKQFGISQLINKPT